MIGSLRAQWAAGLRGVITFALRRLTGVGSIATRVGLAPIFCLCGIVILYKTKGYK